MTLFTVKVKLFMSLNVPSLTVKLRFETPKASVSEVKVAVQFGAVPLKTIFPTGNNAVFDEVADIEVKQFKVLSTSVIVKLKAKGTSSFVILLVMVDKMGASFTGVTVYKKLFESVKVPSVAANVRFEVPVASSTDVNVALQFGAVPLNTIFPTGSKATFEEVADNEVVQIIALSTSVTVKLITKVVSSGVV